MLASKLLSAAGGVETLYVDDCFQTVVRTGTGAAATITTGFQPDLVWNKSRSVARGHNLFTSALGENVNLSTNSTAGPAASGIDAYFDFNADGYSYPTTSNYNNSGELYVDWVLRIADKFYNQAVVTKSAGSNATVSFPGHVTLGMVRVKRTDAAGSWYIWHRSLSAGQLLIGETTAAASTLGHITVSGTTITLVNGVIADGTYLVEAFAHDTSTDGIIQCGSYTGNGSTSGPTVTLGWEPQYVMIKNTSVANDWCIIDSMRGMPVSAGISSVLYADLANAEYNLNTWVEPSALGFQLKQSYGYVNASGNTYIYLAIRRPNKPPTTGTQVFDAKATRGSSLSADAPSFNAGFPPDLVIQTYKPGGSANNVFSRLTGATSLATTSTAAESATSIKFDSMLGVYVGNGSDQTSSNLCGWSFRRAPGVFETVCYTGTGSATTVAHGLGVAPELIVVKKRSSATNSEWMVYTASGGPSYLLYLHLTNALTFNGGSVWNTTAPTPSVFSVGSGATVNESSATFVAYLFATKAGISKVGSYTGNGGTQTIDCGFTTGARFVLIKAKSTTGNWTVWDTTRGITAGSDPYLLLNSTGAEVTGFDVIDPDSVGFSLLNNGFNTSGETYIYLAFA